MTSGQKIVKHLLAKHGPMSNQQLYEYIPKYQSQLVSKHHLKRKILLPLQIQNILHKKIAQPSEVATSTEKAPTSAASSGASAKKVWLWRFKDESLIDKYKNIPGASV